MVRARVRIAFESDSKETSVLEKDIELGDLREPGGQEFVAQHLFSELEKNAGVGNYFRVLPPVEDFLRPVKQTFRLDDIASGSYEDRINTREMWMEIGNTILRVEHLLAESRAYHDQELAHSLGANPEAENLVWSFHLDKMERFDLAIILLGKVSDLTARLIFERLGASLVPNLDRTNPDWERLVTWASIQRGFADRAENPHVASLSDAEYNAVREILADFLQTGHGARVWDYRRKLTHRITPSVDRPELYTHLQSREKTPIAGAGGEIRGWTKSFGGRPTTAGYRFVDLYEDAVQTLRHHIAMLQRLKAIPRFSPEAANAASTAATS